MEATLPDEAYDAHLMALAARGDTAAFDLIVRRYQHRLQRFTTRMFGGDSARGADVAVGALIRLWETRAEYRPCGNLEAWLLRTAYRLCLDQLRRDRSVTGGLDDHFGIESEARRVQADALAAAVRDAVMALPEPQRAVLILAAYEGLRYDEIAQILDISPGTVASRRYHALKHLRRKRSRGNAMNQQDPFAQTEELAKSWTVSTGDIRARVSAATGGSPSAELTAILAEVRALRAEVAELRVGTGLLQSELFRLRDDLAHRPVARIAPYSGGDGLVRLS